MVVCGLVFCPVKIVYAPLLLIGAPALRDPAQRRGALIVHGIILAVVLGGSALWLWSTAGTLVSWRVGTDAAAQLRGILAEPGGYAMILLRTVWHEAAYYPGTVGILGWLRFPLPDAVYALPLLGIVAAAAVRDEGEPVLTAWSLAWKALIVIGAATLAMTAMYLMWTPVGAPRVEGVQGRYMLPLAGLAAMVVAAGLRLPRARLAPAVVVVTAVVLLAATHLVIAAAYDLA